MSRRHEKLEGLFIEQAAEFFNRESNRSSLITITSAKISKDLSTAKIFFTVLPEEKEEDVLNFAKRKRSGFREYLKEKCTLKRMPFIDFDIDFGEKHRQRIDKLSAT